jgi:hypothetical protein
MSTIHLELDNSTALVSLMPRRKPSARIELAKFLRASRHTSTPSSHAVRAYRVEAATPQPELRFLIQSAYNFILHPFAGPIDPEVLRPEPNFSGKDELIGKAHVMLFYKKHHQLVKQLTQLRTDYRENLVKLRHLEEMDVGDYEPHPELQPELQMFEDAAIVYVNLKYFIRQISRTIDRQIYVSDKKSFPLPQDEEILVISEKIESLEDRIDQIISNIHFIEFESISKEISILDRGNSSDAIQRKIKVRTLQVQQRAAGLTETYLHLNKKYAALQEKREAYEKYRYQEEELDSDSDDGGTTK